MINRLKKHQGIFLAVLSMFMLAPWFAPKPSSANFLQVDFWLVWLFAMIILALPITFLEIALAKRSKKTPLIAMEELTRQADTKTQWRTVSWLAITLVALLAGGLVQLATNSFAKYFQLVGGDTENQWVILAIFALLSLGLSFINKMREASLVLAALLGFAATVVSGVNISAQWRVTALSGEEWRNAVLLAVTATGLGAGIFWQSSLTKAKIQKDSIWLVLPIWFAQIFAGIIFALFQGVAGEAAFLLYASAAVIFVIVLLALLRENTAHKLNGFIATSIAFVVGVLLWQLLGIQIMTTVVALLSMVTCIVYSVFAGWKMKISHLRKALKFDNETTYNIWRVAIRLVVPICALSAMALTIINLLR